VNECPFIQGPRVEQPSTLTTARLRCPPLPYMITDATLFSLFSQQ
jgi:hypothetical protein